LGFGGGGVSKLTAHTHNSGLAGDGGDLSETLTDMNGVALYSLITDNAAAVAANTAAIAALEAGGGQEGDMLFPMDSVIGNYSSPTSPATVSSGGDSPTPTVSEEGNWTTDPTSLSNAADGDLNTKTVAGYVVNGNTSQSQTIGIDFGGIVTADLSVKQETRINGAGADTVTTTLATSEDNLSWTTRDTYTNNVQDVYTIATLTASSVSYRYARVDITTNNTGRARYLQVYEFTPSVSPVGTTTTKLTDDNVATTWTSSSEATPYCVLDMGATKEMVAVAIHLDRTLTTLTSLTIDYSVDDTFSGELVRTVLVTDFTDDTWRFIMIPRQAVDKRYFKISSAQTGVLSINEIKYIARTPTEFERDHFHTYLSPTSVTANSEDTN
jgi:hypothetical protein